MRVRVLYFAVVRERLHRDQETLELPDGATVGALLDDLDRRHPGVAALRRHLQVARNRELVREGEPLADGDEVALIPPVAGGAADASDPATLLRDAPLDVGEAIERLKVEVPIWKKELTGDGEEWVGLGP